MAYTKVIFQDSEVCNFNEQGVWFGYESEVFDDSGGFHDVVTGETIGSPDEAAMWLQENYNVISFGNSKIENGMIIMKVNFRE